MKKKRPTDPDTHFCLILRYMDSKVKGHYVLIKNLETKSLKWINLENERIIMSNSMPLVEREDLKMNYIIDEIFTKFKNITPGRNQAI